MNMSPVKKIILAVAAVTIAIALITANNMASVMLIVASREDGKTQQVQTGSNNQSYQNNNSVGTGNVGTGDAGNAGTGDVGTGDAGNAGTGDAGNASTGDAGTGDAGNAGTGDAGNAGTGDAGNAGNAGAATNDQATLDIYKKAVNSARTKSKSVIRVKDGAINYKGIVEAGALSSVGSSLMGMFMVKDAASIQEKNEPWEKEKLPDASNLTLNGIQKITKEEKGNNYVITVVAKNATNPKTGADGVGAVAGVIEESQITGAIGSFPLLKLNNINIDYENVTAVATIDKATGNLVSLDLDAPCILGLDAAMGPLKINGAKVGIEVITEYKIDY